MGKAFGYMGIAMGIVLVLMAVLIAFKPNGLFSNLEGWQRNMIAFILVIYGVFRLMRAYNTLKTRE